MVWSGIIVPNKIYMVIIDGNLNGNTYEVLALVVQFLQLLCPDNILLQGNIRPNADRAFQQYLQQQQVNVLPWPANLLDLSSIEHVWDVIKRQLRRILHAPTTLV
jgi:hypothetical protein